MHRTSCTASDGVILAVNSSASKPIQNIDPQTAVAGDERSGKVVDPRKMAVLVLAERWTNLEHKEKTKRIRKTRDFRERERSVT